MSSYENGGGPQYPDELKQIMQAGPQKILLIILVILGALAASTAYYQVETDSVGIVLRFGKHVDTSKPGLHFKLPFGIDRVLMVPVDRQLKMEFGFETIRAGVQSEFRRGRRAQAEAEMLTGDLNVGIVEWIVQYRIDSPEKYLFNFRDIDTTLRLMSEAAMRSIVGDHSIDELITSGREQIEREAMDRLTKLNEFYDTGIRIVQLKLQDANVPDPVKPALREVEEAKQEKERRINEAQAAYQKTISAAQGLADEQIARAKGYAVERVNEAVGDANRFNAIQAEYRKAPRVTRARLYLEMMNKVLPKVKNKVLVDENSKNFLPLLHLGKDKK